MGGVPSARSKNWEEGDTEEKAMGLSRHVPTTDVRTRGGTMGGMQRRARGAAIGADAWAAHSSGYSGCGSFVSRSGA